MLNAGGINGREIAHRLNRSSSTVGMLELVAP